MPSLLKAFPGFSTPLVKLTFPSFVPLRSLFRLSWPYVTACWPPITKLLAKNRNHVLFMLYFQHLVKHLTHNRWLLNIGPIHEVLTHTEGKITRLEWKTNLKRYLPFYSERLFHFLFCFQAEQVQMFYSTETHQGQMFY